MGLALSPDRWATYYHAQAHRRGSLMPRHLPIAAALLVAAFLPCAHAAEGWRYGVSGELVNDDNATRGIYDGKKSDNLLSVEAAATRSFLLSSTTGALLRAAARYTQYQDIKDISNLALIGRAAWRFQSSPGFGTPWFEVAAQGEYLSHADSELRDGTILFLEASVGSYVTDRTRLSAGFALDERDGGGTAGLYDLSNSRFWGTVDVRVGAHNILYGRVTWLEGDQVFSSGSTSGLSSVWEDDPALREPLGLAVANAYRLDATTMIYEVGFNYPLRPGHALDFSATRYESTVNEGPADGQKYSATLLRASYLYRFQ
jgi:hypothetical protein